MVIKRVFFLTQSLLLKITKDVQQNFELVNIYPAELWPLRRGCQVSKPWLLECEVHGALSLSYPLSSRNKLLTDCKVGQKQSRDGRFLQKH